MRAILTFLYASSSVLILFGFIVLGAIGLWIFGAFLDHWGLSPLGWIARILAIAAAIIGLIMTILSLFASLLMALAANDDSD